MEQDNVYYQIPKDPQLQGGLDVISQAVQGEIEDALFYNYLISAAPTDEGKVLISAIKEESLDIANNLKEFIGILQVWEFKQSKT